MRAKYATVKIPSELAEKLDGLATDMGYRSRAEIVNDAIRRFIDERVRLNKSSTKGSSKDVTQEAALVRAANPNLTPIKDR